jgi:ABC-type multidrug transport system fused ATPase/permease subunit
MYKELEKSSALGRLKPVFWIEVFKKIFFLSEREVTMMMVGAFFLGVLNFSLEFLFLYSLQGFLIAIKITDTKLLKLPEWYPHGEIAAFGLLITVGIIRSFVVTFKTFLGGIANQSFIRIHRSRIFEYSVHEASKTSSHKVSSLFTETIARAGDSVIAMIAITVSLTSTLFLLVAGLKIAPLEMMIGIAFVTLLILPIRFFDKAVNESGAGLTVAWNKVNKLLLEGMKHTLFFKSHGLEDSHIKKGAHEIKSYEIHFKKFFLFGALKNGLPSVSGIVTLGVISFVSRKYFATTSEQLFAFLYIFLRFAQGGADIIAYATQFRLNLSSVDVLYNWTKKNYKKIEQLNENKPKSFNRIDWTDKISLELTNVDFSYDEKKVLKNINIKIIEGDRLIVIGSSGVGKSTLLSIFLGVNQQTSGLIEFNGIDINSILVEYRDNLAYVAPEPFLFEGSIRENLLYGHPRVDMINDDYIWEILDNVLATDYVKSREGGLESLFEEHAEASTGQKQRLAIARALIRNPRLLVLDESTSNLDIETERIVLDYVFKKMENSIVIFVSHRPALERYANKILRLT